MGMIEEREKLENCNFVRTVLMLIIVLFHSMAFWMDGWFSAIPVAWESETLGWIAKWLSSFHNYAFVVVSGYIFFALKEERGRYPNYIHFVRGKAKRLLIPYWFAAIIWVCPVSAYFFHFSLTDILIKYGLAHNPSQLWFLWMLFGVHLIFWPLSHFFRKHNFLAFVAALGFYGLGAVGERFILNIFEIWTACKYVWFFLIGFKLRQYRGWASLERYAPVLVAADVAFFFVVEHIQPNTFVLELLYKASNLLLRSFGAFMIFLLLQSIAKSVNWKKNGLFSFLSARCMIIYLFHQQVIYFLLLLLNGKVNPYLHVILNFLITITGCSLVASILLKYRFTRALVGEKSTTNPGDNNRENR